MAKKRNTKRADGRIAVQVYLGRDENNKRLYKTVYGKTQKEADEKALQVKVAMKRGLDVTAERDTFGQWAERWLKIKVAEVCAAKYAAYKGAVKSLNARFGDVSLKDIRSADLQDYLIDQAQCNDNTGKPSAHETLAVRRMIAINVYRLAIDNRVLEYNPAITTKIPKTKPAEERRALTAEEQRWIEDTPHRAQTAAMIMMYAGLRRGELVPLLWSDIDLQRAVIHINKSVELASVGRRFEIKQGGKTDAAVRDVIIPQKLVQYLSAQRRDSLLVVTNTRGEMHTISSWECMWESYLNALNRKYGGIDERFGAPKDAMLMTIPNITAHWLRHTYATMLYLSGVDVLTAMRQLGHADISTTLGIYTHLDDQYKARAMDKLDQYLQSVDAVDAVDAGHMQVGDTIKALGE